ncbi:hypothetical protein ACC691_40015, partial [Rhizobium johnstonii]|uniref:hypothetical protein n=1 Tax=Rhizobium johnstonii TaxID=3019933 RepID=UPI003F9BE257
LESVNNEAVIVLAPEASTVEGAAVAVTWRRGRIVELPAPATVPHRLAPTPPGLHPHHVRVPSKDAPACTSTRASVDPEGDMRL